MIEIRLAQEGEISQQKELWKLCFGDEDSYIDFYFQNKYRKRETLLLLYNGKITSMLTMMPIRTILPNNRAYNSAMLYAIGTHPDFRNYGFSTELMAHSEKYLAAQGTVFSTLVPAENSLFDFYGKRGYKKSFFVKETLFPIHEIMELEILCQYKVSISPTDPVEYIRRRSDILRQHFYIEYTIEQVEYQQKLSRQSGADIYALDFEHHCNEINSIKGCASVERIDKKRVIIKELLLPGENLYIPVLKKLSRILTADEYLVRPPANLGKSLKGTAHPFGMIKALQKFDSELLCAEQGYLGIAFD